MTTEPELRLDVVEVRTAPRQAERLAVPPAAPWLFAAAMAWSIAVALFGGLVLGILAAAQWGFASRHWTEAVQAHGRLQLTGWVAVFVMALTFEFIVRLNQRPPVAAGPRLAVLGLVSAGALAEAAGQVWHGGLGFLWPLGAALVLAGAAWFGLIVTRMSAPRPLRIDPHPLWFRVAAAWLVAATAVSLVSVLRADGSVLPLDESRLAVELLLRGFVLNTIVAVGLRAFPGHLDLPPVTPKRQRTALAALNGSLVLWALGSGAFALPDASLLRAVADLVFAAALLGLTYWLGVFEPRPGLRHGPRYRVLVPLAWGGLVAYAVALAGYALYDAAGEPTLYQEGAVRHVFMLGFMAPLMVAMAHIVLERFGTGRLEHQNVLTASFVLLLVAWPLRVLPVLFVDAPGALGRDVLAVAGFVAVAALALAAFVAASNAVAIRRAALTHARR